MWRGTRNVNIRESESESAHPGSTQALPFFFSFPSTDQPACTESGSNTTITTHENKYIENAKHTNKPTNPNRGARRRTKNATTEGRLTNWRLRKRCDSCSHASDYELELPSPSKNFIIFAHDNTRFRTYKRYLTPTVHTVQWYVHIDNLQLKQNLISRNSVVSTSEKSEKETR